MKLRFRNIVIVKKGFSGVLILYGNYRFCIDNPNAYECDYTFYTQFNDKQTQQESFKKPGGTDIQHDTVVTAMEDFQANNIVRARVIKTSITNKNSVHKLKIGYLLEFSDGTRVYVTGKTELEDTVLNVEKPIHVLIVSINGGGGMTPEEACEAVKSLKPVLTIPICPDRDAVYYKFRDICQPYTQIVLLRSV